MRHVFDVSPYVVTFQSGNDVSPYMVTYPSMVTYLFVFDENNNHNPMGYPVAIGGVAGRPQPPENLRVES